MPSLQKDTGGKYHEIILPIGTSQIGRTSTGHLKVTSGVASKVHAIVECNDAGCTITDNSRNGTFVNGVRLPLKKVTKLQNGDQICVAGSTFVYCDDCGSGARPTMTVLSSGTTNNEDSMRRKLINHHESPTLIPFIGNGEVIQEKIRNSISLGDRPLASLATTDCVRKLSQLLRFAESVRDFSTTGDSGLLTSVLGQLFPQTCQIAVAHEICDVSKTYRLWLSHNAGEFSGVICDDVMQRVAKDRTALLVRDQWRDKPGDAPKLSTMGRISLMCAPLFGLDHKCSSVIQLISVAPSDEFELLDLERLAILAQLLTIVLPRPASA